MSDLPEKISEAERNALVSMMAELQVEFDKFRENTNARLASLERARTLKAAPAEWDFTKVLEYGAILFFALLVARVLLAALAIYEKRKTQNANFQVSEA
jgi:hypothetical protein